MSVSYDAGDLAQTEWEGEQYAAWAEEHAVELDEQAFLEWADREGLSWLDERGEAEAREMYDDYLERMLPDD